MKVFFFFENMLIRNMKVTVIADFGNADYDDYETVEDWS